MDGSAERACFVFGVSFALCCHVFSIRSFFDAVPLCRQRSANVGLVMQGYRGLILNAPVPLVLKYYSLVLRVHSRSQIRGLELTCASHDGRGSSSAPIPAHPIAEGHACGLAWWRFATFFAGTHAWHGRTVHFRSRSTSSEHEAAS